MTCDPIGVLVANTGTPEAASAGAVRRYLREFLSDPRVVDLPRPFWWLILNLFILPVRPKRAARLYTKIWTDEGSPLLVITRKQAAALQARLRSSLAGPLYVAVGMRYGRPSLRDALEDLRHKGCSRILLLPLFPQYSGSTTASIVAASQEAIDAWQVPPEVITVHHYYDEPPYIRALSRSVLDVWSRDGHPDRFLISFHGLPERRITAGDPYGAHCRDTARQLADELGLLPDRWCTAFQSRIGPGEWLKPYTDETLRKWGQERVRSADVICPGFSADCLETLEEVAIRYRDIFLAAGGVRFRYLPALNDRPDHIEALAEIALQRMRGWVPAESLRGGGES